MMEKLSIVKNYFLSKHAMSTHMKHICVFSFFTGVFSLVYLTFNGLPSLDDPLFHIKFAELIRQNGWQVLRDFDWLYFTKIASGQQFLYYNYLFYISLIPFTFFEPLYLGLKVYGVIAASFMCFSVYYFLQGLYMRKTSAFFWALSCIGFFYMMMPRLFVARPTIIAPVLLIWFMYFLFKRYYAAASVMIVLYTFWHPSTFFIPLIIATFYFMAYATYSGIYKTKILILALVTTCVSVGILAVVSTGFLAYMSNGVIGVVVNAISGNDFNVEKATELLSFDPIRFFKEQSLMMTLFLFGIAMEISLYCLWKKREVNITVDDNAQRTTLFILVILFFLGTIMVQRNIDFFSIILTIYSAVLFYAIHDMFFFKQDVLKKVFMRSAIFVIVLFFLSKIYVAYSLKDSYKDPALFENVAIWLKEHTEENEVIFNVQWDYFPGLFYHNQKNNYIVGMEPRLLYQNDPTLFWKWHHMTANGYYCDRSYCDGFDDMKKVITYDMDMRERWSVAQARSIAKSIKDDFKSNYILIDEGSAKNNDFFLILKNNVQYFERMYRDPESKFTIYKVK